jgi:acetyl esterase/lipase
MKGIFYCLCFFAAIFFSEKIFSQDSSIPLWQNGAPGFENKKNEPELAKDWWVRNINNPSLIVFLPSKEKANGAAVIICPGGGHMNLVYNAEGVDAAKYFTNLGVTAFVLKYRLYKQENSVYTIENTQQDIFRAMRLVHNKARDFNIDTSRIGVMGFSAGGEVAGWVSYHYNEQHLASNDNIDALSAKPAFTILIYPGPAITAEPITLPMPPVFMLAASDDSCCSEPIVKLLSIYRQQKVSAEVHLYAQGSHAFNMGYRSQLATLKSWPQRLTDWLTDNNWLKKK